MNVGAIIGKRQLVLAVLVVALGAAVWLNMKYSSDNGGFDLAGNLNSSKHLGDAQYVNNPGGVEENNSAIKTGNELEYFKTARENRDNARKEAVELLEETINDVKNNDAAKQKAVEEAAKIAQRIDKEAAIESLLKAKDFKDVLAFIGVNDVNIVVEADKLLSSQTMQIQDIVQSQIEISLEKIKITPVK